VSEFALPRNWPLFEALPLLTALAFDFFPPVPFARAPFAFL